MKRLLFFIPTLAALLLAAGCKQEPAPEQPQPVTVTFRVALPEDTKGAGDGTLATQLISHRAVTIGIHTAKAVNSFNFCHVIL